MHVIFWSQSIVQVSLGWWHECFRSHIMSTPWLEKLLANKWTPWDAFSSQESKKKYLKAIKGHGFLSPIFWGLKNTSIDHFVLLFAFCIFFSFFKQSEYWFFPHQHYNTCSLLKNNWSGQKKKDNYLMLQFRVLFKFPPLLNKDPKLL